MLLSKANLYDETDQLLSFFARAFTHPARLAIIRSLRTNGPMTVQEIAEQHPLSLSAISQHLGVLRDTQMVNFKTHYPFLLYSLNEETYEEAKQYINEFFLEE